MADGSERERHRTFLAGTAPFCHLTREVMDEVLDTMEPRHFAAGEHIIAQGSAADGLFVIVAGDGLVRLHHHDGRDSVLADVGPGDVIGEMAMLTNEPRGADVVAVGEVRTLFLASDAFNRLAVQHPELSVVLTEILADRLGRQAEDVLGGKRIRDYRIERCVGRGGMAVVYEATHEPSGARVALKMMNHRLLFRAGAMARFQREADILMALDHPGITRVTACFGAFRTSFLAMEFCDGPVLDDHLAARGPLGEDATCAALGQLAAALDYLHGRRVMHRDLKPGNVMLAGEGLVKLTDFGLARSWDPDPISTGLTTEGAVLGTPYYMAAEQILGRDVGHLGDLYALGCIGLEMLLGRVPFRSKDIAGLIDEKRAFRIPAPADLGIGAELHGVLEGWLRCPSGGRAPELHRVAAWAAPVA